MAAGQGGERLPRPDVLLCCDNICSGMLQWYQAMARTWKVPMIFINIPYGQERIVPQEKVSYLRGELEAAIQQLEQLTGQRWDDQRFVQVCRQANRSAVVWQQVLDTAQQRPSPLKSMEIFDYMPWMVTRRCDPAVEKRLIQLLSELADRKKTREQGEHYRIFWEGTPCWPMLQQILPMLEQRHIQVVADTISHSLCFRYEDLNGLARAYCGTINGVSLEQGVQIREELCRRHQVDGVLVHYNRSCRPWCGDLQEVERRLRQDLALPVAAFDGDQGDPAGCSLAQLETRLDALVEQMAAQRNE